MGESTDYTILTIVGIVGFVAILAMGISANEQSLENENIVGAATAISELSADYNSDGVIDAQDAHMLADIIAYADCPHGTTCDLNLDGAVDEQDLALLNKQIPTVQDEPAKPASSTPSRIVGYSTIATQLA